VTAAHGTSRERTIYFVNQFSRHGHLDLYARLYSGCALQLGYRVVLVAEQEGGVREWLTANHPTQLGRFQFFSRSRLSAEFSMSTPPTFAGRVGQAWRQHGLTGLIRRAGPSVASRVIGAARLFPGASRIVPRKQRGEGESFGPVVDELLAAEALSGWPATLVFFLYLDMMNEDKEGRRSLDERLRRPWSGILFHPRHEGRPGDRAPERYFAARTARGAAFLNPHRIPPYTAAFPGRVFGLVPDVTDATTATQQPAMAAEFTRRAKGRTIVALIGSLTGDKGLTEFLQVIERADSSRFFFVIIGEVFWGSFGANEPAIRRFVAEPPEHCFFHVGYVDDERQLNSMIAAADILYAVYPNQRDSANTLTKASILEKPLVVSEAHLMGERVRAFTLGATVRCGDTDETLSALARLREAPRGSFGFAAYRQAHSIQALQDAFGAHVGDWIGAA
jgi:hypothetical protein